MTIERTDGRTNESMHNFIHKWIDELIQKTSSSSVLATMQTQVTSTTTTSTTTTRQKEHNNIQRAEQH